MSAFIVADAHLNYLISFASLHDVKVYGIGPDGRLPIAGNEQEVFNKLHTANVQSVNVRYRENAKARPGVFNFRLETNSVQALKACQCFDYQACEVENYEETEAFKIVSAIRHAAITSLPGYEAAEWEINEQPTTKVCRLV
jgi:hypothetical protein